MFKEERYDVVIRKRNATVRRMSVESGVDATIERTRYEWNGGLCNVEECMKCSAVGDMKHGTEKWFVMHET